MGVQFRPRAARCALTHGRVCAHTDASVRALRAGWLRAGGGVFCLYAGEARHEDQAAASTCSSIVVHLHSTLWVTCDYVVHTRVLSRRVPDALRARSGALAVRALPEPPTTRRFWSVAGAFALVFAPPLRSDLLPNRSREIMGEDSNTDIRTHASMHSRIHASTHPCIYAFTHAHTDRVGWL